MIRFLLFPVWLCLGFLHPPAFGQAATPIDPRAEFLAIAKRLRDSDYKILSTTRLNQLQHALQRSRSLSPEQLINAHTLLMSEKLIHGYAKEAVEHVNAALALIDKKIASGVESPEQLEFVLKARAVAYIRLAEDVNFALDRDPDSSIFPLREGGVHRLKQYSEAALDSLLTYLARRPEDYTARWLTNLVAMALGRHPEAVPEEFRIGTLAENASSQQVRFRNVASTLGIDGFDLAGAVMVEDFDGDGFLDVITSTFDPLGPLKYYHNLGNGEFEDRAVEATLDQQLGGLNAIAGDYDNDGDMDILVLRGGWMEKHGNIRNSLLRNNGDGTFTDVTRLAGMAKDPMPTQAAAWGDFDNDGDLDLYVANETSKSQPDASSSLFRNNGNGTFVDVAVAAGVTNDRYAKGVAAGDYDNDGDLDLYVSNHNGANRLYRNRGDGTFDDVAPRLGLTEPRKSFVPWFFDFDNDGWLDLFVAAYDGHVGDVAKDFLGLPHQVTSPALYRNNGNGAFTNIAAEVGLDHVYLSMGANFGDLDNDGFLDIYLGTGRPNYDVLVPNIMLRNVGGIRFEDVTVAGGFGHLQKGHGIAFNDLDNDGDQDIYHQLGGFYPGDRNANALFLNPGGGGHYLKLLLKGTRSNRFGVGVRIEVEVKTRTGNTRVIHRAVGSVSSFGGSSLARQEIGLGDAVRIAKLSLWWPASGTRSAYRDVPLDAFLQITEGESGFERLIHDAITFIGSPNASRQRTH